jgi:hypothetical protein
MSRKYKRLSNRKHIFGEENLSVGLMAVIVTETDSHGFASQSQATVVDLLTSNIIVYTTWFWYFKVFLLKNVYLVP